MSEFFVGLRVRLARALKEARKAEEEAQRRLKEDRERTVSWVLEMPLSELLLECADEIRAAQKGCHDHDDVFIEALAARSAVEREKEGRTCSGK